VRIEAALICELVGLHIPDSRPVLKQNPIRNHVFRCCDLRLAYEGELVSGYEERTTANFSNTYIAS
jgi:hypothetical protein